MRTFVFALALALGAAACSPPPAETPEAPAEAPAAPAVDMGPYANSWNAAEFSRFRHTLHAATPGEHAVTLSAQTDAPGGETVALYPIGPDGERRTVRIVYVVADRDGQSAEGIVDFPEGEAGVEVEVVVENAGGRQHAGSYSIAVAP